VTHLLPASLLVLVLCSSLRLFICWQQDEGVRSDWSILLIANKAGLVILFIRRRLPFCLSDSMADPCFVVCVPRNRADTAAMIRPLRLPPRLPPSVLVAIYISPKTTHKGLVFVWTNIRLLGTVPPKCFIKVRICITATGATAVVYDVDPPCRLIRGQTICRLVAYRTYLLLSG